MNIEGGGKAKKCFFTYIHLDLFCSQPMIHCILFLAICCQDVRLYNCLCSYISESIVIGTCIDNLSNCKKLGEFS